MGASVFKRILNIIKHVSNWHEVLLLRFSLRERASIRFRGAGCPLVFDKRSYPVIGGILYLLSHGAEYDPCSDRLTLTYNGRQVVLYGIYEQRSLTIIPSAIASIFLHEAYSFLNVEGRSIVDIGATIGDSSIYFALRGATRVYAYEPIPGLCQLLKRNIAANKLEDVVVPRCKAATTSSEETVELCLEDNYCCAVTPAQGLSCRGQPVRVAAEPLPRADVLKMDCEGCEYSIVGGLKEPLFEEIGLEYHGDPGPLIAKLDGLGYRVEIIKRTYNKTYGEIGVIHATAKK